MINGRGNILDNRIQKIGDFLRPYLSKSDIFRVVSAYFTIYGYEALKEQLHTVGKTRFLFGDPSSLDNLDPTETESQYFTLTERGLSPNMVLRQKPLARECAQWVKNHVDIRTIQKSNFLHGKMYHISGENNISVVGSSNFTRKGLGYTENPNIEINLSSAESNTHGELQNWFDDIWNDSALTKDAKKEVLAALNRIGKDHAPEFVYYKTLFELFRKEIDERSEGDSELRDVHLYDTEIWNTLYDFQKDAVKSIVGRLLRLDGCILADSVGLGKTYTALAVIKYFELKYNSRVLVLCPKKLNDNWSLYSEHFGQAGNPFAKDRLNYTLLAHTDLSRDSGTANGVPLENFDWSQFHLVVIDESHNFRNAAPSRRDEEGELIRRSRYERLLEDIVKKGGETKVLMLSATPVNTSLTDLQNQIYLMTKKNDDSFKDTLGVDNFRILLKTAQRKFKEWENQKGKKDKNRLIEQLGGEFFNFLGGVSIARSRRHIKKFYAGLIQEIGDFPKQLKPENHHPPTDIESKLSYKNLHERISNFSLSIYTPSEYVVSKTVIERLEEEKERFRFNQKDREKSLIFMIRINFLKRLESSAYALELTLGRTVGKIEDLLQKIKRFEEKQEKSTQTDSLPDFDEDDEDFQINRARHPYYLKDLDLLKWKVDLQQDKELLEEMRLDVAAVTPERDGKLQAIKKHIHTRAKNPTVDKDGKFNKKLLVFSTFKDTTEYLYKQLQPVAQALGLNIAMVAGGETHTEIGGNKFTDILNNFAPVARKRAAENNPGEIDLLIATDCISEGQNLQDCDVVLNYDIHWNPVRLIQRFGRIDRIGSRSKEVKMINYWPTEDMEFYLKLQNRVEARMALADAAATGDDDQLNQDIYEKAQLELNFRDEQLKKIREGGLDLDEMSDSVVMSDFSMDYFFSQLLRYLEQKRKELEAAPEGIYAVTDGGGSARPGVIFFLRQNNGGKQRISPLQPFYTIYIHDKGDVRYGYLHAKMVLELFESLAAGKTEPLQALCDTFDDNIKSDKGMAQYNDLLKKAITHITDTFNRKMEETMGEAGAVIPPAEEQPAEMKNFELVTWLVISPKQ